MNTAILWRQRLANALPALGTIRRHLRALVDAHGAVRPTYAQHGEDVYVWERLTAYDLRPSAYIDVGANHPTSLSNTYLLYRHRLRGLVIEPNTELLALHRRYRPGDIAIGVGCGHLPALGRFQVLSTPVLGTFTTDEIHASSNSLRVLRHEYIPKLPLDLLSTHWPCEYFCWVSIDTEGMDYDVILGGRQTLKKTLFLCVEANSADAGQRLREALAVWQFVPLQQLGCNLIFRNTDTYFQRYQR